MKTSTSSNDTYTLGQRLNKERLARGWSFEHVAELIGASVTVVQQLESDVRKELAGVYRDAYLKRYLKVLDIQECEMGGESAMPALQVVLPMQKRRRWLERSIGWARYAVASLIIVPPLVWFSIHHSTSWIAGGYGNLADSQLIQTSSPSVRRLQASQIPARALSGSVLEESSQRETVSGADLTAPESGSQPSVNVLKVYLTNDSWLELEDAEGNQLEHNLLRADMEYSYQGEPPFEVFVGTGTAVTFELNGQAIEHLDSIQSEGLMGFYIDAAGQVTPKQ